MDGILLGKMLDAGFTKEEILSLVDPKDPKPAEENQEQKTDPKPQEEKKEENQDPKPRDENQDPKPQDENPNPKPDNNMDQRLTGIEKQISTLIKAVQANNVKQDSIKTPPENLDLETDKIMESIIRPERQKKEG